MDYVLNLILIIIVAIFVNNVVLAQFLGICPFLGVSKKVDTASGMGMAVTAVLVVATIVTYLLQVYVLNAFGLEYLQTIAFILVIQKDYDLLEGIVYALSTGIGFLLAMVLFAGLREQLDLLDVPKAFRGVPIALVTAGLLAMAFMGFSGVDGGLKILFGL